MAGPGAHSRPLPGLSCVPPDLTLVWLCRGNWLLSTLMGRKLGYMDQEIQFITTSGGPCFSQTAGSTLAVHSQYTRSQLTMVCSSHAALVPLEQCVLQLCAPCK